jgi:hypothetical protein
MQITDWQNNTWTCCHTDDEASTVSMAGWCTVCSGTLRAAHFWKRSRLNRNERLRQKLKERDGNRCIYCYQPFSVRAPSTIEHLTPRSFGGGNDIRNLALAHSKCNGMRSNRMDVQPGDFVGKVHLV